MKTVLWSILCLFLFRMGKYANGVSTGLARDGKELVRYQRGFESRRQKNIVGSFCSGLCRLL